jgi:Flp pilus assembly protein TadB
MVTFAKDRVFAEIQEKRDSMIRKTMKMLLVAVVAVCTFGAVAEAAPKKAVRHRAKHSTRVSSSAEPSAAAKPARKATTKRRAASRATATAKHKPQLKTTTKPR